MNVSEAVRSSRSIGLSRRPGGATVGTSRASVSRSASWTGATGSSVGVEFAGESDMSVLLIRCLESELYAVIVALSIILGGACLETSFDTLYPRTCPTRRKLFGLVAANNPPAAQRDLRGASGGISARIRLRLSLAG